MWDYREIIEIIEWDYRDKYWSRISFLFVYTFRASDMGDDGDLVER